MAEMVYKVFGQGHPIIVIHGLYGMSDNWLPFAKKIEQHNKVYLLDVRNHGLSPHYQTHTYNDICTDILQFFYKHQIEKATLLGHSMGGKAAMLFALQNPERISSLVVADIAPVNYKKTHSLQIQKHSKIINSLLNLPLDKIKNRTEAEQLLNSSIGDIRTVRFLLKNLVKTKEGYIWRLNIKVLQNSLKDILEGFDSINLVPATSYPVLFLKGSESDYITVEGEKQIRRFFPFAKIITIKGAGHWLHAEKPDEFYEAVISFLE